MKTKKKKPETETEKKPKPKPPFWTLYEVRWDFTTRLCGQTPGNPKLIEDWLKARQPKIRPPSGRSIAQITEEVVATLVEPEADLEEELEAKMLVFQRQNNHIVMRASTTKAHMKDCSRWLSTTYLVREDLEKAFSTKVINGVYPDETQEWIPILRTADLKPIPKADDYFEQPTHIFGPKGHCDTLKCIGYVEGATMIFRLKVFANLIGQTDLEHLFRYGGVHGYAGERGNGYGRYSATIKQVGWNVGTCSGVTPSIDLS